MKSRRVRRMRHTRGRGRAMKRGGMLGFAGQGMVEAKKLETAPGAAAATAAAAAEHERLQASFAQQRKQREENDDDYGGPDPTGSGY